MSPEINLCPLEVSKATEKHFTPARMAKWKSQLVVQRSGRPPGSPRTVEHRAAL